MYHIDSWFISSTRSYYYGNPSGKKVNQIWFYINIFLLLTFSKLDNHELPRKKTPPQITYLIRFIVSNTNEFIKSLSILTKYRKYRDKDA